MLPFLRAPTYGELADVAIELLQIVAADVRARVAVFEMVDEYLARRRPGALLNDTQAARAIGVSLKTFRRHLDRHPHLEDPTDPKRIALKSGRQVARWPEDAIVAWWHNHKPGSCRCGKQ